MYSGLFARFIIKAFTMKKLLLFCLFACLNFNLLAEGYPKTFFASLTLATTATGSISITEPIEVFSIYQKAPFSYRFTYATSTVYVASSTSEWATFTATEPVLLQPLQLSDDCFLWLRNDGGATQNIKFRSYGK